MTKERRRWTPRARARAQLASLSASENIVISPVAAARICVIAREGQMGERGFL
jgi:hypothetical protein